MYSHNPSDRLSKPSSPPVLLSTSMTSKLHIFNKLALFYMWIVGNYIRYITYLPLQAQTAINHENHFCSNDFSLQNVYAFFFFSSNFRILMNHYHHHLHHYHHHLHQHHTSQFFIICSQMGIDCIVLNYVVSLSVQLQLQAFSRTWFIFSLFFHLARLFPVVPTGRSNRVLAGYGSKQSAMPHSNCYLIQLN